MDDLMKRIRSGEMPIKFYRELAKTFANEPPKNNRMRFLFDAPFHSDNYSPPHACALTVMEYADICEGETMTARSVVCPDASDVVAKGVIPFHNRTLSFIETQLRERFESLDAFTAFCKQNNICYEEQPLWIDEHSFNEYTGEHRGDYAPFAPGRHESGDMNE